MSSPGQAGLDVEVEVNELGSGQVEMDVRVPPEPVAAVRNRVMKAFGRRASIPGFRKGKAPRAVVERYIDQEALGEQIVEALLGDAYDAAVEKAELKPLDRARIGEPEFAEDGALTFSATVTLRPKIELGEHRALKVTRHVVPVTESQVDSELERVRSRRAVFQALGEEAAIEKGDMAVVDYEMFVDGEKREDASVSGYPLEVGADQLFPELNEALPGRHPGDMCEVEVKYPEDHSETSLAGKTAQFKVTVREARRRELPELNDEFAGEVSDLETLEALRGRIRENLEAIGKAITDQQVRDELVRQVSDAASLDVPQALVEREVDRRIDETTEELERRNLTLPQHLRNIGRSFEDWRADIEAEARQAARRALVLDEIGVKEKTRVGEQEIQEEIRRQAEAEEIDEKALKERLSDSAEFNRLVTRLYQRKVVALLVDNAEISEEIVQPEAEEEPQAADTGKEGTEPRGETEGDSKS